MFYFTYIYLSAYKKSMIALYRKYDSKKCEKCENYEQLKKKGVRVIEVWLN